eukprot:6189155-Pleurochrysis_carterae.AAC.1
MNDSIKTNVSARRQIPNLSNSKILTCCSSAAAKPLLCLRGYAQTVSSYSCNDCPRLNLLAATRPVHFMLTGMEQRERMGASPKCEAGPAAVVVLIGSLCVTVASQTCVVRSRIL